MSNEPTTRALPLHIGTWSRWCAGNQASLSGGATITGLTWVANLAQYIPMYLPFAYPVRRVFWSNGTGVAGSTHADVGIYSWGGARIFSIGSTTMVTASTIQYTTLGTDVVLAPGNYWIAFTIDSATASLARGMQATTSSPGKIMGCVQQATALPLPATMTPAAWTQTGWSVPFCGITRTSTGF